MTAGTANRDPGVKAILWRFAARDHRARLGEAAWARVVAASGLAEAHDLDEEADLPARGFAAALEELARAAGEPFESVAAEAGRRAARSWGAMFPAVVGQFRGQPERLLRLALEVVLPHWTGRAGSFRPLRSSDHETLVGLRTGLPGAYERGLLEGFVELGDAEPLVRQASEGTYQVAWRVRSAPPPAGGAPPWRLAVRVPFLAGTVVPAFVGLAIAAQDGAFDPRWAFLTLVGVVLFQTGATALNAYFELVGDGSPAATKPAARPERLKALGYTCYALGTAAGLLLVAARGMEVLWLGLAGFLLGFLYTAPPVRLAHRGLGELAVALGFGPLIVMGTYFVQRQAWSLEALLASLPLAFLITAVLYINEFPDKEGDARVGKRTLIVRLPEKPAVVGYVVLLGLTYLVILGGVALRGVPLLAPLAFPPWTLLGLITLPLAVRASVLVSRNYRYPYRLVPANAATIVLHFTTGALFCAGYLIPLLP